jgi:EAL domain-containing protein (putative c-di-GMP-specific phosphodiesterase class I)
MTCTFESLFQPIVDTAGHRILAHQCDACEGIDVAIRSAAGQSTGGLYFINSWILNPCFPSILDAASESGLHPSNIVFEIAETAVAEDPGHWRRVCDWYRQNGFRVAMANAGAGQDSLHTFVDLQPDYIKLEKTLVWDIEKRPNTVMIRKLADLAEKFEVSIMADGVERHRTVENLWLLSVNIMQGALFGRPASGIVHSAVGHEPVEASSR